MGLRGLGPETVAVASTLMALNTFFIALRLYVRARVSKSINYNDGLIVMALAAYGVLLVLLILAAMNGIGGHTTSAVPKEIGNSLKAIWFLELIYVILTSFMKVSIAITLLQWARGKVMTTLLRASVFLDFAISAAFTIYLLLQCTPISYAWTLLDPTTHGKCLSFTGQLYMGYALSFVTISLDMLFLFGPIFMLKGRGVNRRLKVYIFAILGLGVLASLANFIRLGSLVKLKDSADPLFDAAPVFTWSAVEVSIGIMVAGILECGPLMRKYNVKGFEDYKFFANLSDDDTEPMNLQRIDKSQIIHQTSFKQ